MAGKSIKNPITLLKSIIEQGMKGMKHYKLYMGLIDPLIKVVLTQSLIRLLHLVLPQVNISNMLLVDRGLLRFGLLQTHRGSVVAVGLKIFTELR